MNIQIEKVSDIKRKLVVEISLERINEVKEKVIVRVGKSAKIPGFRPGKIPKAVLNSHYGALIEEETVNDLVKATYPDAVKEKKLDVIGHPKINVVNYDPQKALTYEAVVELYPVIELKKYSGFKLDGLTLEVSDKEVDDNVAAAIDQFSTYEDHPQDYKAQSGDVLNINFIGKIDGQEFEGGKADGVNLELGSKRFIPGFEEQLIGRSIEDEFSIKVTFPEDYQANDLKGKEAEFNTKINTIKKKIKPEWDEDLLKKFAVKSKEEFVKEIRDSIESQKKDQRKQSLKAQVLQNLVKENQFEVPSFMLDTQTQYIIQDSVKHIKQNNPYASDKDVEKYIKDKGSFYKDQAEHIVRSALLLEKIAEKEKLEINDQDVEDMYKTLANQFGQTVEQIKQFYNEKNKDALRKLKEQIKEDKIVQFVVDGSKVKDK